VRYILTLTLFVVLYTASSFAQNGMPACDGDFAVVRVSQISAGGTVAGFMDAVKDHLAWYRANGIQDNIIVASRIVLMDKDKGPSKYSETEVMTYHIRPPAEDRIPKRGDDAWKAYVKKYRDNSEIKSEYVTCMPKFSR
jgi:hypothetical protein